MQSMTRTYKQSTTLMSAWEYLAFTSVVLRTGQKQQRLNYAKKKAYTRPKGTGVENDASARLPNLPSTSCDLEFLPS